MDDRIQLEPAPSPAPSAAPARPSLRLRTAIILLTVFWIYLFAVFQIEMAMFVRFISRWLAYGVLFLLFLGWWLARCNLPRRDRFRMVGLMFLCGIGGGFLADRSIGPAMFMLGFPICFTAWTAWLLVTRQRSRALQRAGLILGTLFSFGYFELVRWDGLDGAQHALLSWRWEPTAEDRFRAEHHEGPATQARTWVLQSGDWPEFRGSQRDGAVHGVTLPASAPRELWRRRVGPAWSSVIVVDGFLVTQEQRGENEAIVCYDAATGNEVWAHEEPDRFKEGVSGIGPRGTPTFREGRIYAVGGRGRLTCVAASDGKRLWSREIVASTDVPQWGVSTSPLVADGKVLAFAGGATGLVACDAATGDIVWTRSGGKQSYSSPQLVTLHGQRQVLMHDNQALRAVRLDDGEVLWEHPNASEIGVPMLQPQLLGDGGLLIPWDPGIARLDVKHADGRWSVTERWTTAKFKPDFNDFVMHKGHLYGLDNGFLCCIDLETGRRLWKDGRYGHGQLLLLADHGAVLVLSETGELALVAANPARYEERLGHVAALQGKTWNHPVVGHDRLFVRNGEEMACFAFSRGP